jgi:hypothetical protein
VPASKIVVTSWERVLGSGHVVISGSLRNDAPYEASEVSVTVLLNGANGKLLASAEAVLSSTILPAGRNAGFQADFPDVFSCAAVKLEVRGVHLVAARDTFVTVGNK